jgi:predicted TIM-barrel fold metal-dependent hydrolase
MRDPVIDGMPAVDGHCHIGVMKGERHGIRTFSAEDLIARMDENGIDHAVVCHLISPLSEPEDFPPANDLVVAAMRRHPARLTGLVAINPAHGRAAEDEARRGLQAGLRGIKVHPALHGRYPVDGPLLDPIMALAAEAGVPLVTHCDVASGCCTPRRVAALAARWPMVRVLLLHLGMDAEAIEHTPEIVAALPNVFLDTSNTPDYPHAVFVNPVRRVGADRVAFGSDGPVVSVEANLAKLRVAERTYGLSREEKRSILGVTAAAVFGLS